MKPSGRLVVTVPRRHIFTFLDHGNLKYVFPAFIDICTAPAFSGEDNYLFVDNRYGLFGDVAKREVLAPAFHRK
jgi:hypothetical protein